MISLPPDEATRDCPVETEFENKIIEARKKCDMPAQDEYYYYEYEEFEEYDAGPEDEYQDFDHVFSSDVNDNTFDEDIEFVNEIIDSDRINRQRENDKFISKRFTNIYGS